jgi:hypothetical protein
MNNRTLLKHSLGATLQGCQIPTHNHVPVETRINPTSPFLSLTIPARCGRGRRPIARFRRDAHRHRVRDKSHPPTDLKNCIVSVSLAINRSMEQHWASMVGSSLILVTFGPASGCVSSPLHLDLVSCQGHAVLLSVSGCLLPVGLGVRYPVFGGTQCTRSSFCERHTTG